MALSKLYKKICLKYISCDRLILQYHTRTLFDDELFIVLGDKMEINMRHFKGTRLRLNSSKTVYA